MIIAIIILVLVGLWGVTTYNGFVSLIEKLKNSKAQIAVQMESRWDALTNLISATEKYSDYEKETLEEIIAKRNQVTMNSSLDEIQKAEDQYSQAFGKIVALAEAYPDLKASEVYKKTMDSVNKYEDNVRYARMTFNDMATKYNRARKQVPKNIIASIMGLEEEKYFALSENKNQMPSWQ